MFLLHFILFHMIKLKLMLLLRQYLSLHIINEDMEQRKADMIQRLSCWNRNMAIATKPFAIQPVVPQISSSPALATCL